MLTHQQSRPLESPPVSNLIKEVVSGFTSPDRRAVQQSMVQLSALVNHENHSLLTSELLPGAVASIEQLIQKPFSGNPKGKKALETAWTKLQPARQLYGQVLDTVNLHSDRFGSSMPLELAARAHIPLLVGPARFTRPRSNELKRLDSELSLSPRFVAWDTTVKEQITSDLKQLKLDQILNGRLVKPVSIQAICDVVMKRYGFAPVPVVEAKPGEDAPAFRVDKRKIQICSRELAKFPDEQKVWAALHEVRHALQYSLVFNYLSTRKDGTPHLYKHNQVHPVVSAFTDDMNRFFIGLEARKIESQVIYRSSESIQARYALQFTERDADQFASHVIALVLDRDSAQLLKKYQGLKSKIVEEEATSTPARSRVLLAEALDPKQTKLVLPSAENFWKAGNHRDEYLERSGQRQSLARKEGRDPFDSFADLLIRRPKENQEDILPPRARQLERDGEFFSRVQESLMFRVRSADLSSIEKIESALPVFEFLVSRPLCGQNGLEALKGAITSILDGPLEINATLRERLENLGAMTDTLRHEVRVQRKRSLKEDVARIMNPKSIPLIPLTPQGLQESLWDTCDKGLRALTKNDLRGVATMVRAIEAHIKQGQLGTIPKKRAATTLQEMSGTLKKDRDDQVSVLLGKQLEKLAGKLAR